MAATSWLAVDRRQSLFAGRPSGTSNREQQWSRPLQLTDGARPSKRESRNRDHQPPLWGRPRRGSLSPRVKVLDGGRPRWEVFYGGGALLLGRGSKLKGLRCVDKVDAATGWGKGLDPRPLSFGGGLRRRCRKGGHEGHAGRRHGAAPQRSGDLQRQRSEARDRGSESAAPRRGSDHAS